MTKIEIKVFGMPHLLIDYIDII